MIEVKEKIIFTLENDDKTYDTDNSNTIILLPELINYNKELIQKYFESKRYKSSDFLSISIFSEGLALVRKRNGKYIYIDKNGNQVIPYEYYYAHPFNNGLALVQTTEDIKRYSFIDHTGKIITSNLKEAHDFNEGFAAISINDKWGFINQQGEIKISCSYKEVSDFHEGLAAVQCDDGKWKYISPNGDECIQDKFTEARDFHEGLAYVKKEENARFNASFIDKEGNTSNTFTILPDQTGDYHEDFAMYCINGKFNFIDKMSKPLFKQGKYDLVLDFSLSRAAVSKNSKWGYINEKGEEVIPCIYDEAYNFSSEGLARVRLNDKWGYINSDGQEIIPFNYIEAKDFSEGLAMVTNQNHDSYFINKEGETKIYFQNHYLEKINSYHRLISILSDAKQENIIIALDIVENKIHFVKSWKKLIEITNEKGEKTIISPNEAQDLVKKLVKIQ